MNRQFRNLGAVLSLAAVLTAAGSHWLLLQSVAWGSMLFRFVQEDSLATALEKTFDGRHPCALCHQVQAGQKQEQQKPPLLRPANLPDLFCEARRVTAPPPPSVRQPATPTRGRTHPDFVLAPPKPPPRAA